MSGKLRKKLRKKSFTVRLSDEQRADVEAAAGLESAARDEIVEAATLFRECGMRGIREILARHREHEHVPVEASAA